LLKHNVDGFVYTFTEPSEIRFEKETGILPEDKLF